MMHPMLPCQDVVLPVQPLVLPFDVFNRASCSPSFIHCSRNADAVSALNSVNDWRKKHTLGIAIVMK